MHDLINDIDQLLNEIKPETLLLIGDSESYTFEYQAETTTQIPIDNCLSALDELDRYDLVIVIDALKELSKVQGEQLLGRLRNLHAKRLLLCHSPNETWQLQDFLAFALTELNHYPSDETPIQTQLYEYNIHSYKSVPDWLNNKFWANPNMWNKYRW